MSWKPHILRGTNLYPHSYASSLLYLKCHNQYSSGVLSPFLLPSTYRLIYPSALVSVEVCEVVSKTDPSGWWVITILLALLYTYHLFSPLLFSLSLLVPGKRDSWSSWFTDWHVEEAGWTLLSLPAAHPTISHSCTQFILPGLALLPPVIAQPFLSFFAYYKLSLSIEIHSLLSPALCQPHTPCSVLFHKSLSHYASVSL